MKINVNSQDIFQVVNDNYQEVNTLINKGYTKIGILVDNNTHEHCLPRLLPMLQTDIPIEVIEIESGEEVKNLDTCQGVWETLSELGFDRKSLLINLGGGVLTDIGGYIAACFKRGIAFINIPTTLLAMVDAAVGGKTGVNLGNLKNQIGVIKPADLVVIDTAYLQTLSPREMRSGLAEMFKHGLIADKTYWDNLGQLKHKGLEDLDGLIIRSIEIKSEIVEQDPFEDNIRKSLNYGHTLGHAIESYFLGNPDKSKLLHGEAIVIGMIMASYISTQLLELPQERANNITAALLFLYPKVEINSIDKHKILDLLKYDKKNKGERINFVLLNEIGKPALDCEVPDEILQDAFQYYSQSQAKD